MLTNPKEGVIDLRLNNKILSALRRTSGASMIFVLGVMMFLMAIGVSTLSAAFANAGYVMRQSDFARVRLLHESIHENIMFSLQFNPEDESLLGYQIVMAILASNDEDDLDAYNVSGLSDIELDVTIDGTAIANFGGNITVQSVTLKFPDQFVNIYPAIPEIPQFPPNPPGVTLPDDEIITKHVPREPKTATVNASMVVEVVISSGAGNREITSIAVYEYTGGRFIEESEATHKMIFDEDDPDGFGVWEMVRHEIIGW
jgi:hypothetical protein